MNTLRTELFRVVKLVFLILLGFFFLAFGTYLLIAAYHLKDPFNKQKKKRRDMGGVGRGVKDPFNFIMTFFASNLIILISVSLLIGFFIRLFRPEKTSDNDVK